VAGVDYPRRVQRSTVKGQLVLNDLLGRATTLPNLRVGMTAAAYASPVPPTNPNSPARQIDWQTDAKHYQFWTRGDELGRFAIPNVRPGRYTLRAFADGVLGEFMRGDVTVEAGKPLNLGRVEWTPVRRGKPLWEIGIANRNGSEFFKGGEFYDPEMPLKYARLFPDDVKYVIGQSDFRRDWFFQHVPHNEDPNAKSQPYVGIRAAGRPTPYAVMFDVAAPCRGRATLRLAICGGGAREIEVMLNDQSVGKVDRLLIDGAITRHTIQGLWYEREVVFDAALLQPGRNTLKLIVPAGPVNNGVIYDYLRLEWDETARARIAGE
jgi:rhamnogalacturonan endolyase